MKFLPILLFEVILVQWRELKQKVDVSLEEVVVMVSYTHLISIYIILEINLHMILLTNCFPTNSSVLLSFLLLVFCLPSVLLMTV